MNDKLRILLFLLKNLPKFMRLCAQLLVEWYKLDSCQKDEVGTL